MDLFGRQNGVRSLLALLIGTFAMSNVAQAQTGAADTVYLEGFAQTVRSNTTSQAFGGEFGVSVVPNGQLFAEVARVNNVATPKLSASAQAIAAYLAATQTNVGYSVQEPVTIGVAGIRFVVPTAGSLRPYFMAGGGFARVTQNVAFTVGGADVTSKLAQYGVVLGTDLSGSFTKPMLAVGGGIVWAIGEKFLADLHYRYGRIYAPDQGININRVGLGLGVRF
jgi:opacity protein-like surface antigen